MRQLIIQFGGTGDLAVKKLYPAYSNLLERGYDFTVIALGRRFKDREEFIGQMIGEEAKGLIPHIDYVVYDTALSASTAALADRLRHHIGETREVELIYYIALQPSLYEEAIVQIRSVEAELACACTIKKKIVVEKPFGFDLGTARTYNEVLLKAFSDREIYRVDHYLGKEFMQNLLIMRFHNDVIRSIWNNRTIESIQIIFDETHGVDQRLGFYEQIGVVRDTIQNHILQIVTYLTMAEPASFSPEDIATEKIKVLRAIRPITDYRLGQYASLGTGNLSKESSPVKRAEAQARLRQTPTYAALRFTVNTFYFAGIPIYIRTGKMQDEARSLIYVRFKNTTKTVMNDPAIHENGVIIRTHPELTIDIAMNLKEPNTSWHSKSVQFRFNHADTFGMNTPEAYEQILEKIINGDKSLFPTMREIEESWRIVAPMIQGEQQIDIYEPKTLPSFARELAERDGETWFT